MSQNLKIRPFARLLTMLGDQLIKNEQIAVVELIKNSYDADADWVKVSFENFTQDYKATPQSRIIVEDNGCGMTREIIERAWMNPATPNKYARDNKEHRTPIKHRVIQGEKGIGRYAMLKLGSTVNMTTRPLNGDIEYTLCFDVSEYGSEFIGERQEEDKFLDELEFPLRESTPQYFSYRTLKVGNQVLSDNAHGTRIEITNLRGQWSRKKMEEISKSIYRFGNFFDIITNQQRNDDFLLALYFNGDYVGREDVSNSIILRNLLETQSVFQITDGHYDSKAQTFRFKKNGHAMELPLSDPKIRGNRLYKNHFTTDAKHSVYRDISNFGDFKFDFYVFDLAAKEPSKFALVGQARDIVKEHRVYLLRDGIRVMPYGDADDDWLQIDTNRGTFSAGGFLSNDQLVGRVEISKYGNEHLKDKTNREGLIDEENYTRDFIVIISVFLSYLRTEIYKEYLERNKSKQRIDKERANVVLDAFRELKKYFKDDQKASTMISQLEKNYEMEKKYCEERVRRTEALAAVGLSVEVSSHDIMLMFNKGVDMLMNLQEECQRSSFDIKQLPANLERLYGIFSFVKAKMKDLQLLFVSSKQRRRQLRVEDILEKVIRIYKYAYEESHIDIDIEKIGSPLMATCTDADLLQLFINLFDNSLYWLETVDKEEKLVLVTLDGNNGQLIFSDNGPGIRDEDTPYIFEAFFSGKGQGGRGLGLYISRQIMERNEYNIRLAQCKDERLLEGANFVVSFVKQEND